MNSTENQKPSENKGSDESVESAIIKLAISFINDYEKYPVVVGTQTVNVYELPFPVVSLCSPSSPTTNSGIDLKDIQKATFLNKEVERIGEFIHSN
jgi:hypothetical protein